MLAEAEGDKLSENELLSMIFVLIVAGHETTVNLIGNGMLALFEHPEQRARLRETLSLLKAAIEEMLRYYGPVEMSLTRWVRQDTGARRPTCGRGEQIMALLASANHDGEQFPNPDVFDISREPNRHIAFGTGIHACLGATLARLEGTDRVRDAAVAHAGSGAGHTARRGALARRNVPARPDAATGDV